MGIYGVKSRTCNCRGSWSTLDPKDYRVYMTKPCEKHMLTEGNTIYYELKHLFKSIINNFDGIIIREKYPCKILRVEKIDNRKTIVKLEVIHNGDLNINNFDNNKKIFYSQMNDEAMWREIDENTIHIIITYQSPHHTVEENWEREDY